jgi:primary-amine oxidase
MMSYILTWNQNADTKEIIHIDVPKVRRPLNTAPPIKIKAEGGFRKDLKPLYITQPEGVSFTVEGRIIKWQNWSFHVGFNYRLGIVLSNITFSDHGNVRPVFWRLSLAEMVVPYGNPEHPHQRKHAFDLGEYGGGYMTNSLALGCDCKGAIHYMDAAFVNKAGEPQTIKNAICIHEEDTGILFKHTDFRDDSSTVTRARKLVRIPSVSYPVKSAEGRHNGRNWLGRSEIYSYRADLRPVSHYLYVC